MFPWNPPRLDWSLLPGLQRNLRSHHIHRGKGYIDICIYTHIHIHIYILYTFAHTHTTYVYNLHIYHQTLGHICKCIYMYIYIYRYVKIIDVLCKEKYPFCRFENTKTPVVAAAYVRTSHEPGPPESAETGDWAKELGLANGFSAMLALLMGWYDNPGKDHVQHQSLQTLNPLTIQKFCRLQWQYSQIPQPPNTVPALGGAALVDKWGFASGKEPS